jgi:short-subunit dehydrogenase
VADARRPGSGQTALVTGASGGIGVDLADCFARDGYDVIVTARSQAALEQVASRLAREHSIAATPIPCDLAEAGGARKLAQSVAASGLRVDVLVNNAGYGHAGPFTSSDLETQVGMIDLNVRALVELTHLYWDAMRERRRGGVLNVASTAAFQPGPFMAVYYASKAFVLSFSEALWEEARGTGVKVSCLCPGPTLSGFRARAGTDKTKLAAAARQVPSMPVAEAGYRAFQNDERVVVTGARNRLVARLVPMLPRRTVLRMVRELQSPR